MNEENSIVRSSRSELTGPSSLAGRGLSLLERPEKRILLSDDDPNLLRLYRSWLQKHFSEKYTLIILESDGRDAVEIFRRERQIDLVVSDINANNAGIERVKIFKIQDPHVKIMLASGRKVGHLVEELLEKMIIDVFLQRPFREEVWVKAVENSIFPRRDDSK
jgi:DNA-binding NtrC family response regulator